MYTNVIRTNLLAAFLLAALFTLSTAQDPPATEDSLVGIIPGTEMSRDEFRARANAQLSAAALNAEAYRLVYGEYPGSFYALYNSSAWNLELLNMFTGEPVDAIQFLAEPTDLIPHLEAGLPAGINALQAPPVTPPAPPTEPGEGGNAEGSAPPGSPLNQNYTPVGPLCVDPGNVTNIVFGDVFYRTSGDTLQLLMFAPDGTYAEVFHAAPNLYWQKHMAAVAIGAHWPDDGYAGQVMYFTETMLPRFYNHVMFMADLEVLPGSALHLYGVGARLQMAEELGIYILNPYTKQPIQLVDTFEIGNFVEPNPGVPMPVFFCFKGNRILSLNQIFEVQEAQAKAARSGKKSRNPRRPAIGGSR